jgi:hypothetical protein
LGDAVGERRPPNAARTKHVPQTLDPARFRDSLGDATGDALKDSGEYSDSNHVSLQFCSIRPIDRCLCSSIENSFTASSGGTTGRKHKVVWKFTDSELKCVQSLVHADCSPVQLPTPTRQDPTLMLCRKYSSYASIRPPRREDKGYCLHPLDANLTFWFYSTWQGEKCEKFYSV